MGCVSSKSQPLGEEKTKERINLLQKAPKLQFGWFGQGRVRGFGTEPAQVPGLWEVIEKPVLCFRLHQRQDDNYIHGIHQVLLTYGHR